MASKFQNRLVGTIILVAVGVIVLPVLLDGDKKYNEDQFAAIPLVPKSGDEQEIESVAPINQTMPSMPSEGVSGAMISEAASQNTENQPTANNSQSNGSDSTSTPTTMPPVLTQPPTEQIQPVPSQPQQITPPVVQPVEKPKSEPKPQIKPEPKPTQDNLPKGQAYIVQLGVLTNAKKVEEIIAKLSLSGYPVYTVPRKVENGKRTAIFVGPNASKDYLQSSLDELYQLTELKGQVKAYKP